MKLRIAVCDDENEALTKESRLIRDLLDEKHILYDIDEYVSADQLLSANLYDMVFLDVEMGNVNGINVAKKTVGIQKRYLHILYNELFYIFGYGFRYKCAQIFV